MARPTRRPRGARPIHHGDPKSASRTNPRAPTTARTALRDELAGLVSVTASHLPHLALSPERETLRESVGAFLDQALSWERVAELDDACVFPRDVWLGLGRLGALGLGIPEQWGGSGGSVADSLVVCVEIAKRYPSLAVDYVLCGMVARMLLDHGSDEQKLRYLPDLASGDRIYAYGISEPDGGTDALALRTSAHVGPGGGWVVSGSKLWISMAAEASTIFTLVRTDRPDSADRPASGTSIIAIPTAQQAVSIRKVELAAMRGAGTCEVVFQNAAADPDELIGARGSGFRMLWETLVIERLLSAGISIGIGAAAVDYALDYAAKRTAFGRPIGAFQAVAHPLVDSVVELSGGILLTDHALSILERGEDASFASSAAKLAVSEATARVVDRCARVLGAMGIAKETPMQMWFRDARLGLFSPVSNEMIRNALAREMGLPRSF